MEGVKAIQILKQREKDNDYITSNYNELVKKYENKFIAVKEQKIVASGNIFEKMLNEVKRKGIDPSLTVIIFMFKKDHEFIL